MEYICFLYVRKMCDDIIRVIGNFVILNFYYYFVLGILKILLVILKYIIESCKLQLFCYVVDYCKLFFLFSCIFVCFFYWFLFLVNYYLVFFVCLLIDLFDQLDVNLLNC